MILILQSMLKVSTKTSKKRTVIRVHRHKNTHSLPDTMREIRTQGRIRSISGHQHPLIFSKNALSGMIKDLL